MKSSEIRKRKEQKRREQELKKRTLNPANCGMCGDKLPKGLDSQWCMNCVEDALKDMEEPLEIEVWTSRTECAAIRPEVANATKRIINEHKHTWRELAKR